MNEMLYAVATADWGHDVAGTLYDHEGEPIHGHMSSSEGWLWRDLTTGFPDRARSSAERYPHGYEVTYLGRNATPEDFEPLHGLWDKHHPGWRDDTDQEGEPS